MKDNELYRKSIMMANELSVAGEFIYAAIEKINRMLSFEQVWDNFYFLYHLAVGIERVQKVLLVILNDVERANISSFLESIKGHDHKDLHSKICTKISISFSKEQNELLSILSEFYNDERYKRFDFFGYNFEEVNLLVDYTKKNCKELS